MDFSYTFIFVAILVLSPVVLAVASRQGKLAKQNLKNIFLFILSSQIILGFLNWENFSVGRSGFELSLTYPDSFLGLFFIVSLVQIILLCNKSFNAAAILNFINSVLIFVGMIRVSSSLGYQVVSLASVGAVFLVLVGNVVVLTFINKDKNLVKKYFG